MIMNHEIVKRQGTHHVFPNTIPKKRSSNDVYLKAIFSGIAFGISPLLTTENWINFLINASVHNYLFHILLEIPIRISSLFEELNHLHSRYDGSIIKLLKEIFGINYINAILIPISIVGVLYVYVTDAGPFTSIIKYGIPAWTSNYFGMDILVKLLNLHENSMHTVKQMDELKGLDYGSGMAYSFFYGYLNLLLPCFGDERTGLKEQMEKYESNEGVEFASKKLYIFIPLSAHCPTSIDAVSNRMSASKSLDWIKKDRAGVKDRQYHNSVYKVYTDKKKTKPIYVCAEFATPLLTLYEVMDHDTEDSRHYKRFQKEIVTNFYMTLYKIIKNNRDCRDLCELIYYRDIDANGDPLELDVGDLLLEKLFQDK